LSETEGNRVGRYRRIAHLATGGMAEIHLAALTGPRGFAKLVVIKQLLPELAADGRFVTAFLDEARIASRFVHPNVVHTLDVDSDGDRHFIVMEYLPGENLAATLTACAKRGVQLPPGLAAWIVMKATEGLHHIHTRRDADDKPLGIVHRDISPENVFVLYDGEVKLVDFGITLAPFREAVTRTGVVKGKLFYMSPEQVRGGKLDARSDVFSMGVVLWESLTCAPLFPRDNDAKTLAAIATEDAPSPLTRNPDLPDGLCQIVLKALARNPSHRYGSSGELRAALAGFVRSHGLAADTAAVERFMHDLFADRIRAKARVVERALPADEPPGSEPEPGPRWIGAVLALVFVVGALVTFLIVMSLEGQPGPETPPSPPVVDVAPAAKGPAATESLPNPQPVPVMTPPAKNPPTRDEHKTSPRRAPKTGRLRLMTTPWTTIYHKGVKLGQTPLIDVRLPAGAVKLRAVNDEAGIDRWITVRIKPGQVVTRRHNFP
jgi:serine/threonine-protein kinase